MSKPDIIQEFESQIWGALFEVCFGQDVKDALFQLQQWWMGARQRFMSDNLARYWWRNIGGMCIYY